MATGRRPFRVVVYLPGHDETGHLIVHRVVAYTTEPRAVAGATRWRDAGYLTSAYEELTLTPEEGP